VRSRGEDERLCSWVVVRRDLGAVQELPPVVVMEQEAAEMEEGERRRDVVVTAMVLLLLLLLRLYCCKDHWVRFAEAETRRKPKKKKHINTPESTHKTECPSLSLSLSLSQDFWIFSASVSL
jgi:hypothetical protein